MKDNCEYCKAMTQISDDGPMSFTSINLFKPHRSIMTRPPMNATSAASAASAASSDSSTPSTDGESKDVEDNGAYTPQEVLNLLWPYLDR